MHVAKYTSQQCGQMLTHYNRNNGQDRNYSNENIDKEKSHLNYNLGPERDISEKDFMTERLENVKHLNRADVIHMADWAVTLPQDYKGDSREFFEKAYDVLATRYGEQNVISAYVHMDEKTPHMHFAFMPICIGTDRNGHDIEKLSAKEVITREDLREIHPQMEKQLTRELGREVHLLNGATREGNRSIKELQRETAIRDLEKARTYEKMRDKEVPPAEPKKVGISRAEYVPYSEHMAVVDKLNSVIYDEQQKTREWRDKAHHMADRVERAEDNAHKEYEYRLELEEKLQDRDYLKDRIKELDRQEREDREQEKSHSDLDNRNR